MADHKLTEHIVVSRDVLHGQPRIINTRIAVYQVLDLLGSGETISDIISEHYFPELTEDDVFACLNYASRVIQNEI